MQHILKRDSVFTMKGMLQGKSDALKTKINSKFGKMVLQAYGPVPRQASKGTLV